MSFESIWDSVGRLAGEVAGIKAASTPQATSTSGVRSFVRRIADTPVAWVEHDNTPVLRATSREDKHHNFVVVVYFRMTDPATAWKLGATFPEKFLATWAGRAKLYNTAESNLITGWDFDDGPDGGGVLVEDMPYLLLNFHVEVVERTTRPLTAA